ncbi:MAG: hypothetical protein GY928_18820 [Colwellia sp.]|nr:hypothetical protein [Colwellia sp.]
MRVPLQQHPTYKSLKTRLLRQRALNRRPLPISALNSTGFHATERLLEKTSTERTKNVSNCEAIRQ